HHSESATCDSSHVQLREPERATPTPPLRVGRRSGGLATRDPQRHAVRLMVIAIHIIATWGPKPLGDPGWRPVTAADYAAVVETSASFDQFAEAVAALTLFAEPRMLTLRIRDLERRLFRRTREQVIEDLRAEDVTLALLQAALGVKRI